LAVLANKTKTVRLGKMLIIAGIVFLLLNSVVMADTPKQFGGLWFWAEPENRLGSSQTLTNPRSAQTAIRFFKAVALKRLYGEYIDLDFEIVANWNAELEKNGIESELLLAKSYWIFPRFRHEMFETLEKNFIDFNNRAKANQRFKAVHLNLEPHALELWKQGSAEQKRALLELMRDCLLELKSFFLNHDVKATIIIDLPVWYDDLNSDIAWRSAADRDKWFSSIDNIVEGIVLLSYGRDASATIVNTGWELNNLSSIIAIALDADIGKDAYWHSKQEF